MSIGETISKGAIAGPQPVRGPAPLLRVAGLSVHFPVRRGPLGRTRGVINAVDQVSFDLDAGETLGLVGESGCGKTTLGRAVVRLIQPASGGVYFDGEEITA